jgi:hypothetical protein
MKESVMGGEAYSIHGRSRYASACFKLKNIRFFENLCLEKKRILNDL